MDPPITSELIRSDPPDYNETFQLISDETRVGILLALWEHHEPTDPAPLPFSTLREHVGVDDPGRLNYHLNSLRPSLIRRNPDGYELRESGKRIVRMLLSGTAIRDPEIEPVVVDMACWFCNGQTEWSYRDGKRVLTCTSCEARCVESFAPGVIIKTEFPPSGLLDRTPDEINEADRVWATHRRASVMDGVCPECVGPMPVTSIEICDDHQPDWDGYQFCDGCGAIFWMLVTHVCEVCKYSWRLPTLFYPTRHPAVTAFFYDHGIELDLARFEQRAHLLTFEEELQSVDPLRINISIPLDGDVLELTYDDQMSVIDVRK